MHITVSVLHVQVGSLIIFFEYDRNRRKEIRKQHKEAAERQGIIERAREEREVGSLVLYAMACAKGWVAVNQGVVAALQQP